MPKLNVRIIVGVLFIVLFVSIGLDPKLFTHFRPTQQDPWHSWDSTMPAFPPSRMHWLGTDEQGHDYFSMIIYGILPTLRDATVTTAVTMFMAFAIAIGRTLYNVHVTALDRLTNLTTMIPPVLLSLLILDAKPIYFSAYSPLWYYGVIAAFEISRLVPTMEGDIRRIQQKPFMEGAVVAGGSQWWIFRKHLLPWLWAYLIEYVASQYGRILAVMGELGYFGIFTHATIIATESGNVITTNELDWPALIAVGSHDWFTVPLGVLWPTLALILMIFAFRLIASGISASNRNNQSSQWIVPRRRLRHWMRSFYPSKSGVHTYHNS